MQEVIRLVVGCLVSLSYVVARSATPLVLGRRDI
jgi:hypothetical protein